VHRRAFTVCVSSLLVSAGAGLAQAAVPESAAKSAAQRAYELATQGHGFATGPVMAANTVYVFFDSTCPHCAHQWDEAKPLLGKLKVVWIPVGILRPVSLTQGATILAAPKPAVAMTENEARVMTHLGGIPVPANVPEDAIAKVKANTALFEKTGVDSVPLVIWRHARTGVYGSQTGAVETAQLAALVGL
jgi:thiol:disulfide interchange protein DsbG